MHITSVYTNLKKLKNRGQLEKSFLEYAAPYLRVEYVHLEPVPVQPKPERVKKVKPVKAEKVVKPKRQRVEKIKKVKTDKAVKPPKVHDPLGHTIIDFLKAVTFCVERVDSEGRPRTDIDISKLMRICRGEDFEIIVQEANDEQRVL